MVEQEYWRKCGPCKKGIPFEGLYYTCSASSCRKQVFCSRDCWSAHVPIMRHKDAWHDDARAPSREAASLEGEDADRLRRKRVVAAGATESGPTTVNSAADLPQDILIVASKLKQYIKARSDMNTSAQVMERLSDMVRIFCDQAIVRAREEGRRTVLDRDFHL